MSTIPSAAILLEISSLIADSISISPGSGGSTIMVALKAVFSIAKV